MLPFSMSSDTLPICAQVNSRNPRRPAEQSTGCPVIWRPWTIRDTHLEMTVTGSSKQFSKDIQAFHHPVRLFMPRSKTQEYLSHLGRTVLASFPVQATLHFYNDDSSSDEENGDGEETKARGL
uniref:Protein ripply3 n=1 Tax=Electrophorus electricus TaxID=8005 RepID=A0A4W4FPF2_ELEEL